MKDVVVIGGGVVGGLILRELTKYKLDVAMIEKNNDVAMGQSRANSGIVHAGFDAKVGTNKAKFNVLGNRMMEKVAKDLGVKYINNGALVVAFSDEDLKTIEDLKERGIKNGVKGLRIIGREELVSMERNISDEAKGALFAETSAIICPYELTISAIGNAMDNGAELFTSFNLVSVEKKEGSFVLKAEDGRIIETKYVINAAASGAHDVSKMFGDESVDVHGRRGEYILLDRESGDFVSHTLFFTPTAKGKGILVSNTVDGNILLGPTAEEVEDFNVDTSRDGLLAVQNGAKKMCKNVPLYNTITSFSGTRVYTNLHDFVIKESEIVPNLFNLYGIESPGLTSSPAIAKYVVEELIGKKIDLKENENFNGVRPSDFFFKHLSVEEKNEYIKKDSRYGRIICRCEQVTEGEIVNVIHRNPKCNTIDGVKRRIRAGMGRCQGGFCSPSVLSIISRELGIPMEEVKKGNGDSFVVYGRTK